MGDPARDGSNIAQAHVENKRQARFIRILFGPLGAIGMMFGGPPLIGWTRGCRKTLHMSPTSPSTAAANAALDAAAAGLSGGTLRIYESGGTVPTNCAAAATGTELARITLSGFAASSGGVAAASGVPLSASINFSGDADYARVYDSSGVCRWQDGVGYAGALEGEVTLSSGSLLELAALKWQLDVPEVWATIQVGDGYSGAPTTTSAINAAINASGPYTVVEVWGTAEHINIGVLSGCVGSSGSWGGTVDHIRIEGRGPSPLLEGINLGADYANWDHLEIRDLTLTNYTNAAAAINGYKGGGVQGHLTVEDVTVQPDAGMLAGGQYNGFGIKWGFALEGHQMTLKRVTFAACREHSIYAHNMVRDNLVEDCDNTEITLTLPTHGDRVVGNGRTFFQHAGRFADDPTVPFRAHHEPAGTLTLRRCTARGTGSEGTLGGGSPSGGSPFTVAGFRGPVLFDSCSVERSLAGGGLVCYAEIPPTGNVWYFGRKMDGALSRMFRDPCQEDVTIQNFTIDPIGGATWSTLGTWSATVPILLSSCATVTASDVWVSDTEGGTLRQVTSEAAAEVSYDYQSASGIANIGSITWS